MIWISIPIHNNIKFTLECLSSLYRNSYKGFKVVICDDGSIDNSSELIRKNFSDVILLEGNGNLWWGGATNCIFQYIINTAQLDDYILMLNNDLIVEPDFLEKMINTIDGNELLSVIVKDIKTNNLIYAGELINKFTASSKNLVKNENINNLGVKWNVDVLTGRGVLFPVKLLNEIGFIDSKNMPQYAGDAEFSVRAKKKGYKLSVTNKTIIYSHSDNTGLGSIYKKDSIFTFLKSFITIKSPNYYKARFYFAKSFTYKFWILPFFILQYFRIIGGFIKRKIFI